MNKYKIIILITGISGLISCNEAQPEVRVNDADKCIITLQLKSLIEVNQLSPKPVNKEIEFTGSVSYDEEHVYRYQSLVNGVVQRVNFKIGDHVTKGQVLAEVRTAELNEQKAGLHKLQSELKLAQRKLKSVQNLHEDGVASDKDLLEATNDLTALQTEIEKIKETLALQGGNVEKGLLLVRAPQSGYVVNKKITAGYQVTDGEDDLFVLADLKKIWVLVNVYATQLDLVKVGQTVKVSTSAYPDKVFTGRINRLSNVFDSEERVLKAIVELDNADLLLKPSMMVRANVYQPSQRMAIAIPRQAALFANNAYYVLAYTDDQEDLKAGDSIITHNQLLIYTKLTER